MTLQSKATAINNYLHFRAEGAKKTKLLKSRKLINDTASEGEALRIRVSSLINLLTSQNSLDIYSEQLRQSKLAESNNTCPFCGTEIK